MDNKHPRQKNQKQRTKGLSILSLGISGGKPDTAPDLEQKEYLRSCHFLLFCVFSGGCYTANTPLHLEKIPSKASTELFILQLLHLQTEGLEKLKRPTSPVLSQERFGNNHLLPGDQPVNFFLYCSLPIERTTLPIESS